MDLKRRMSCEELLLSKIIIDCSFKLSARPHSLVFWACGLAGSGTKETLKALKKEERKGRFLEASARPFFSGQSSGLDTVDTSYVLKFFLKLLCSGGARQEWLRR